MLNANAAGNYIEYSLNVPEAGTYYVTVRDKTVNTRGIYQLSVNGNNYGDPVDLYSTSARYSKTIFPNVTFETAGEQKFRFTVIGKNAASQGYSLGLDSITLSKEKPVEEDQNPLRLWYRKPANSWMKEALPIGNGNLGGMIYGAADRDRIQLNEATIFSGQKITTSKMDYDKIQQSRDALDQNDFATASTRMNEWLTSTPADFGEYQNLGDLYLAFDGHDTGVGNYTRELDISKGVAKVSYEKDGKTYTREYFSSHPDNVMVIRLTCSEPSSITASVNMNCAQHNLQQATEGKDTLIIDGTNDTKAMSFQTRIKILAEGGEQSVDSNTLKVTNVDSATIVMSTRTSYTNDWDNYAGNTDYQDEVKQLVNSACSKTYDELKESHVQDYQSLFNRVNLNLKGSDRSDLPTDARLEDYRAGYQDSALETLLFQYGRYMLISSSRQGGQPANLQGLWNNSNNPAWGSMYCFNINFNMNYWPAETTNLSECHLPEIDLIDKMRPSGRETAKNYFNIDEGWFAAKKSDVWGFTMPYKPAYGIFMGGSAWLCQDVWEYYSFTRDKEYLEKQGYPVLKEASEFYLNFLTEKDGKLISSPTASPENSFRYNNGTYQICAGTELDHRVIEELLNNTIQAAKELGVDDSFRMELEEAVAKIPQPQISQATGGGIQEWYQADFEEVEVKHRHLSNLYGVFPGNTISPDTNPELSEAAKVSLKRRGEVNIGWSDAWKINLWANLFESAEAYSTLRTMINGHMSNNLFDIYDGASNGTVFQIEGNFGYTSGVVEMLLQSENSGKIHFLPALPTEWAEGSVTGLMARGDFEIGMEWAENTADKFTVSSNNGGTFTGKYDGIAGAKIVDSKGQLVQANQLSLDEISFDTVKGETYTIMFEANGKLQVQIDKASQLSNQMTDSALANAKEKLDQAIAHAVTIVEGSDSDAMIEEINVLTEAFNDAQAALDLSIKVNSIQTKLDELAQQETWSYLGKLYESLSDEISRANELLQSVASRDSMTAELAVLDDSLKTADGNAQAANSLHDVIANAEEVLASLEGSGFIQALIDQLAAEIDTAKNILDMATTAAEFKAEADRLNQLINDINDVDNIAPVISVSSLAAGEIVTIESPYDALDIRFTLDGTTPTTSSFRYTESFAVPEGTSKLTAALFNGDKMVGKTESVTANVAPMAKEVKASNVYNTQSSFDGQKAVDGDMSTRWATDGNIQDATLELTFDQEVSVNGASIAYLAKPNENEINRFNIEYWDGQNWIPALENATIENATKLSIGTYNFDTVSSTKFRLNLTDALRPSIWEFTLTPATTAVLPDRSEIALAISEAEKAKLEGIYDSANQAAQEAFDQAFRDALTANEDITTTAEQLYGAAKALSNATDALKVPVEGVDKTILNKVIEKAQTLLTSDEYLNAISSVQQSFKAALDSAVDILDDDFATQEQVDAAWVSLMTEIHKLGLQQGNKDLLQEHYDLYSQLNLNNYLDGAAKDSFKEALAAAEALLAGSDAVQSEIDKADNDLVAAAAALVLRSDKTALQSAVDSTQGYAADNYAKGWEAFDAARNAANEVLNNPDATQEQIDQALDALIEAMLNLRLKADKSLLNAALAAAEALDLSGYSKASVEAFQAAYAQARAAAADESLSTDEQDQVDAAVNRLSQAVQNLNYDDGTSANLSMNDDGSIRVTKATAKTGETAPIAAALLLLAGAAFVLKKRR